jgi:hypothetical protein
MRFSGRIYKDGKLVFFDTLSREREYEACQEIATPAARNIRSCAMRCKRPSFLRRQESLGFRC